MPSDTEIAPHVDELARALEGTVGPDQIRKELERYLAHGVPLHQAKRDILTALGGARPRSKKVKDITPQDQAVDVVGKVLSVTEREVTARGEQKKIWSGLLGDETGAIAYTAWVDLGLEEGQVLTIANAYIRTWRGTPQLNIGERTEVTLSDQDLKVPDDVQARAPTRRGGRPVSVKELRDGMSSVSVTGRILGIGTREIQVQGEPKTIWEGELADETGRIPYTSWHDHGVAEGQVLKIDNAYVKAFRGIASLNFGENSTVTTVEDADLPSVKELDVSTPYSIRELEEVGGALGVQLDAVVLDIRPGSGLILRCPECRRVLQKRECRLHGRVEGLADLRIKAVVDDGTGAITALFNRALTEEVLGRSLDECQAAAKEAMSFDVIEDEVREKVLCRRLTLEGNAAHDDFGTTLIVTSYRFPDLEDLTGRAEALLERISTVTAEVAA